MYKKNIIYNDIGYYLKYRTFTVTKLIGLPCPALHK